MTTILDAAIAFKFEKWVLDNDELVKSFIKFALIAKSKGHKKISAWLIVNRVRWETEIVGNGCDYKINNNYISHLSRKVMREVPELEGFFTIKG